MQKSMLLSILLACITTASQGARQRTLRPATPDIQVINIDVPDYPLPLQRLGEVLERRIGLGISYEDAPWAYSGDLVLAVSHPANREFQRDNPWTGAHVARGGPLGIKYTVGNDSQNQMIRPDDILRDALDVYSRHGYSGEFRILALGEDGFTIVPIRSRDENGQMIPVQSPLDSRISFQEQNMTGEEGLELIRRLASMAAHKPINRVPHIFYPRYSARLGAHNEVARDVLLRLVHEMHPADPNDTSRMRRIAWQLNYAPDAGVYWFDWHLVIKVTVSPGNKGILYAPIEIVRSPAEK